jgi:hypothetical protein
MGERRHLFNGAWNSQGGTRPSNEDLSALPEWETAAFQAQAVDVLGADFKIL